MCISLIDLFYEKVNTQRFQWASLQIATLCDHQRIKVVGDVVEALERSPQSLVESYGHIYKSVNNLERNGRTIALKVFAWLIGAQRTLSIKEALALFSNDRDFIGLPWVADLMIETLLACCCTLVVVDDSLGILRFAHPSVREYDDSYPMISRSLEFPRFLETQAEFEPGRVHLTLAQRCLDSYVLESGDHTHDELSGYASMYWALHCEQACNRNSIKKQLLDFLYEKEHFHDSVDSMQELLEHLDRTSNFYKKLQATLSNPVTPLFAIACFGLVEAIDEEHAQDLNLNQLNSHGASCLYLAARWGHHDAVAYFIDRGVDIDRTGGMFGSALQAASFAGHAKIVRTLIYKGASAFNPSEFPGAIQAAIAGGHEKIVTLLLEAIYMGSHGADCGSVLIYALFEGSLDIVRDLARHGILEVGMETPLQKALAHGKERASRRLLEETLDVNAKEGLLVMLYKRPFSVDLCFSFNSSLPKAPT